MAERDDILEKIRKCMALSASGSEHEAAAALRQARKLMELHQVSHAEMLAAGVGEANAKSAAIVRPANWESQLAGYIAHVFGCRLIFLEGWDRSQWVFIGLPPANEVAAYSFEVLFRQAKKARQDYITNALKRHKKSSKVRRADLFSIGWVRAACSNVTALTSVEGAAEAVQAYMEIKHPKLGSLNATDRNKGRTLSSKDEMALSAGRHAGRSAQLHHGVGAGAAPLMLEGV
jgi:hypothetical protein